PRRRQHRANNDEDYSMRVEGRSKVATSLGGSRIYDDLRINGPCSVGMTLTPATKRFTRLEHETCRLLFGRALTRYAFRVTSGIRLMDVLAILFDVHHTSPTKLTYRYSEKHT